jgi:hypothetical protein
MLERGLDPATDVASEAVNVTAMHLRRIVRLVSTALARAVREVEDLVWDYQDLAGDLRRYDHPSNGLHDAGSSDLHWPATGYPDGTIGLRQRLN